jgi:hypothetical protein
VTHLGWHAGHGHEVGCDVLEQGRQVDFLLIVGAECAARLLADDGDHRDVIHLGIIETIEKMDRTRAGRRVAKTNLAGEFRVRRRHEGGHFFMPDLDILHAVFGFLQRHVQASDTVAGVAVHSMEPPFLQAMPHIFADVHGHGSRSDVRAGVPRINDKPKAGFASAPSGDSEIAAASLRRLMNSHTHGFHRWSFDRDAGTRRGARRSPLKMADRRCEHPGSIDGAKVCFA